MKNKKLDNPGRNHTIHNRGISGNKVFQLDERWEKDCLELKPNLLSILIGVNDSRMEAYSAYQDAAKLLADEFDTFRVPFQEVFNEAVNYAPEAYWLPDGVHPSLPEHS